MKLTYKEIGYLSRINNVYQYPYVTQVSMFLDDEDKTNIRKSLTEKEILSEGDLTDLGLRLLHILEKTSDSKEYVKWNHMWIFFYRGSYVLIRALSKEELQLEQIGKEELMVTLLYFLNQTGKIEEKKRRVRHRTNEQMLQFMHEHPDIQGIFYEKVSGKKSKTGVIQVYDGYMQHFQAGKEKLDCIPRSKVYASIERIVMGGAESVN
ncbi:MAG: DUF5081 family protein [Coprobacillaceae bacterium]